MTTNLRVELHYPGGSVEEEHYSMHARRFNNLHRGDQHPERVVIYGRPVYETQLRQFCLLTCPAHPEQAAPVVEVIYDR